MLHPSRVEPSVSSLRALLNNIPSLLLAVTPLAIIQPILGHIASHIALDHPELFDRLGSHARKRFMVDSIDLPFVLILSPDSNHPTLRAYRRYEKPAYDAVIAGKFLSEVVSKLDRKLAEQICTPKNFWWEQMTALRSCVYKGGRIISARL